MLDTGIDVRELVNLVFAKPVFSYTKFWQMIGRGTRLLEPQKMKPWCKEKDKFLIIDCWENFDYFEMNPTGRIDKASKPLPVRLFEALLQKLNIAESQGNSTIIQATIQKLKENIAKLPQNNVVILDAKSKIEKIDEGFWLRLSDDKKLFLEKDIAPLMRTRTGEDYKAMSFELKVLNYSIARIDEQEEQKKKIETL